jgi:hypothetical protein
LPRFTRNTAVFTAALRLVSVALFVALRRLGVTQHPALWSPDFPLAAETFASDCLASFGGDFTALRPRQLDFASAAA